MGPLWNSRELACRSCAAMLMQEGRLRPTKAPQQYILYVIAGTGKLALVDKDGATTVAEVKYKPDDVIVFQPDTLHNWKNDSGVAFEFLGVVPTTPRK